MLDRLPLLGQAPVWWPLPGNAQVGLALPAARPLQQKPGGAVRDALQAFPYARRVAPRASAPLVVAPESLRKPGALQAPGRRAVKAAPVRDQARDLGSQPTAQRMASARVYSRRVPRIPALLAPPIHPPPLAPLP